MPRQDGWKHDQHPYTDPDPNDPDITFNGTHYSIRPSFATPTDPEELMRGATRLDAAFEWRDEMLYKGFAAAAAAISDATANLSLGTTTTPAPATVSGIPSSLFSDDDEALNMPPEGYEPSTIHPRFLADLYEIPDDDLEPTPAASEPEMMDWTPPLDFDGHQYTLIKNYFPRVLAEPDRSQEISGWESNPDASWDVEDYYALGKDADGDYVVNVKFEGWGYEHNWWSYLADCSQEGLDELWQEHGQPEEQDRAMKRPRRSYKGARTILPG